MSLSRITCSLDKEPSRFFCLDAKEAKKSRPGVHPVGIHKDSVCLPCGTRATGTQTVLGQPSTHTESPRISGTGQGPRSPKLEKKQRWAMVFGRPGAEWPSRRSWINCCLSTTFLGEDCLSEADRRVSSAACCRKGQQLTKNRERGAEVFGYFLPTQKVTGGVGARAHW